MKPQLGVCYYPEHWPEAQWPDDAARMVETGLEWVRIGEFAWSRLEPNEGDLRWEWLDRAVEVLGAAGLKVVMGTPTATPPRWVCEKHPDMFALDANGHVRGFGSRRHYCFSHEGYCAEAVRITRLTAERYGRNPHIAAWQTDNEYGCHDTVISYSDAACTAFRIWLEQRYGNIGALNDAWGNVFWSMEYRHFGEVFLPNLTVTEPNPSHVLDFQRFSSDQVVQFNRAQAEVLRELTDAPLIHNYMGRTLEFDHFKVGDDLDVASWDSYPLGFLEDRSDQPEAFKQQFARQGDPDFQAFHHDIYRAVGKGRWWVMEQQPGPVNWAPHNPDPLPGMARLWAWEAFAHGAEAVLYFRWRQAPMAQEQMHSGLLRPDSVAAPALGEAAQVAAEAAHLDLADTGAPVALVFDYESAWAWNAQPQGAEFDYFRLVFDFYKALRKLGLSIDIVPPSCTDLSPWQMVVIPGLLHWGALKSALEAYEGVVVAGPRTASKTADMQIPIPMGPNMPGVDATVARVESLRPDMPIMLDQGGTFQFWREVVEGRSLEDARDGHPARVGTARRQYLAGWPDERALHRILADACDEASLPTLDLPEGLRVRDIGAWRFAINYANRAWKLSKHIEGAPSGRIAPADVSWWLK
ncbi:beta-galactosidase [Pontivivens insulae]|uniref:Beta-galactosidase n=1 Tax=Pontivivens insulae TaxID=1639689 RepID=A0A2R8AEE0_9RHOB|nr:beta-galactosidase [Pontivivens insulae]RED14381.1 beta-galactosidase [Pontivivens insulae]SPF30458.1 Beta-galactosidase [Pontivivens insulae]